MSNIMAGLLAGALLAVVLMIHLFVRGKILVQFFQSIDTSNARLSSQSLFLLILICYLGAGFLFGMLSGLVYGWFGLPVYHYLAFGAAALLSLLALFARTPLASDKVFWNVAVGGILGMLVPIFAV